MAVVRFSANALQRGCLGMALLGVMMVWGCGGYVPPPKADLAPSPTGTYVVGDTLTLRFSGPIVPETLAIRVLEGQRDLENALDLAKPPLLDTCTLVACASGTELVLNEERTVVTLTLDAEGPLGKPDVPRALEVAAGLRSADGSVRRRAQYFDFQFKPKPAVQETPVDFDSGPYMIVSTIKKPFPTTVYLISDLRVSPDNRLRMVSARGQPKAGFPKGTKDPAGLYVVTAEDGFAVFVSGTIRESVDPDTQAVARFIETDPFNLEVRVDPFKIVLHDMRFTAKVLKNPDTGKDRLEGTISYSKVVLSSELVTEYEASTATFLADWSDPSLGPEGAPRICGDHCGVVRGLCQPPADLTDGGMCPELASEE